jgi:hypothetical protein
VGERQVDTVLRGSPGQRDRAATGTGRRGTAGLPLGASAIRRAPGGGWGRQKAAARAERSDAGAFHVCPLGGDEVRQGAAAVRARCRADGGPERGQAAQREAGAVRRRRGISLRTDRSADRCADWPTVATARARALVARRGIPPAGWRSGSSGMMVRGDGVSAVHRYARDGCSVGPSLPMTTSARAVSAP